MTIFKPLCVNTSGVAKNKLLPQDVYGIRRTPWPPSPLLRVRLNLRGACCALRFERHGEARERLGELPGPMRVAFPNFLRLYQYFTVYYGTSYLTVYLTLTPPDVGASLS